MKEWLSCFFYDKDASLIINGETYYPSQWKRIGGGSEKHVFKIKDKNFCFLIPHKWSSREAWNNKIKLEKLILDEMRELGMETQQFELVEISISSPSQPSCTIQALVTKDFESLCKDEALALHDPKGDRRVFGTPPDFMAMRPRFKDKSYVQEMFKKIIKEYATAYTFSLPVTAIQTTDDSQHICFELSPNTALPPTVRYMFWDVVSDIQQFPFVPTVPTLSEFRKGPETFSWRNDNGALKSLANTVACAILDMLPLLETRLTFIWELENDILRTRFSK